MKRVYNNYFLVGLFTIIIGGLAIFALFALSSKDKGSDVYYSYFDNVTGLKYGNPVYYEGYRVGQVEAIIPKTNNGKLKFKVDYSLIEGWKIPIDSITEIKSSGLLSDMSLSVKAGIKTKYFPVKSEIKGIQSVDMMAVISKLASDFGELNEKKIIPLLDLVYERTDRVTQALDTKIPEVLNSINILINDTNLLINDTRKLLNDDNKQAINNIVSNLNIITNRLSSIGAWVEKSISKVDSALEAAKDLILNSDLKISKFLNIANEIIDSFAIKAESIANEIESASMNMNEATEIIRKNPKSLLFKSKSEIADEDL